MSKNIDRAALKTLAEIRDPNEFIGACRKIAAAENGLAESDMFPLPEDASDDVIYSFMGIWLAMSADLPLENKEQVIAATDRMIAIIQKIQSLLPDDPERLKDDLLHCLRQGMAPRAWEI